MLVCSVFYSVSQHINSRLYIHTVSFFDLEEWAVEKRNTVSTLGASLVAAYLLGLFVSLSRILPQSKLRPRDSTPEEERFDCLFLYFFDGK